MKLHISGLLICAEMCFVSASNEPLVPHSALGQWVHQEQLHSLSGHQSLCPLQNSLFGHPGTKLWTKKCSERKCCVLCHPVKSQSSIHPCSHRFWYCRHFYCSSLNAEWMIKDTSAWIIAKRHLTQCYSVGLCVTLAAPQCGQSEYLLKGKRVMIWVLDGQDFGCVQSSPHSIQHRGWVASCHIWATHINTSIHTCVYAAYKETACSFQMCTISSARGWQILVTFDVLFSLKRMLKLAK